MKQAVILCAGKGSRLTPLTDEIPKVLIDVNGVSILEHKLKMLEGLVDEVVLVVGHLGEKIERAFGNSYGGLKILYCYQGVPLGTGHAVLQARKFLRDRFVVLNGDDFYSFKDLEKLCLKRFGMIGFEAFDFSGFGVLEVDLNGNLVGIEEKPENPKSNLVNVGAYAFDVSIFDEEIGKSERGEYEIVDYLKCLIRRGEEVGVLSTSYWVPVNDFDQLEAAREVVGEHINS